MANDNGNGAISSLGKLAGSLAAIGVVLFIIGSAVFATNEKVEKEDTKLRTKVNEIDKTTTSKIYDLDTRVGKVETNQQWMMNEMTKQSRALSRIERAVR